MLDAWSSNEIGGFVEERLRENDKFWDEVRNFITESREYRATDKVTQKFQAENLEALKNAVTIQNGRVVKLESWRQEIDQKIKQRKDNYANIQAWITGVATIVMAISAWITIFKK